MAETPPLTQPPDDTLRAELARLQQSLDEYRRTAEQLEQYRALTENAPDLIFTLDRAGAMTFINRRVETLLGYAPEEFIGQSIARLLGADGAAVALGHLQRSLSNPQHAATYELAVPDSASKPVYLAISVSTLSHAGQVTGQQGAARDISAQALLRQEADRRSAELRLSEERRHEMRDYMALVTRVLEEERKRVARELHDDTAQALVALARSLDALMLHVEDRPAALRRLEETRALAESTLSSVRRFSRDLRPSLLDDLGLVPALEWLTDDLTRQAPTTANLEVVGEVRRLAPEVELCLFRVAQEALSNIRRHAAAERVDVSLLFEESSVTLIVADNGVGFSPTDRPADLSSARGLGLRGMRERAELIGGQLTLSSTPHHGTRVEITAPV